MIIPLGLGFKTKSFPFITWAIIAACSLIYFAPQLSQSVTKNGPDDLERMYRAIPERHSVERAHDHLFYEHCSKNFEVTKICDLFAIDRGLYLERDDVPAIKTEKKLDPNEVMVRFSRFYKKFRKKLNAKDSSIRALPSYAPFAKARDRLNSKIQKIREDNHLLHRENLTVLSVLLAMFSHESIPHLFGNMLFLFLFGRYVESRLGHLNYAATYLVLGGAALGLYAFFAPEMYFQVMGASANVAAMMGVFYGLFFHKKFRVFFFYLFYKSAELPVKTYMFLLFMLQEFIFTFTSQGNVAYMAHALGLGFGVLYGFGYRRFRPVPKSCLYEDEALDWKKAQTITEHGPFIQACLRILRYNPKNKPVLRGLISEILEHKKDLGDLPLEEELHLRRLIPIYIKDIFDDHRWEEFFHTLDKIPHSWSLSKCLNRFDQKSILRALDEAIDREHLISAIKLIQAFSERYQNSSKIYNLLKTLGSIIRHMEINEHNLTQLQKIKSLTTSKRLSKTLEALAPTATRNA